MASPADIAIFGSAAGCGKSFSLLMEAARWKGVPHFKCAVFRRQSTDITKAGGLWHKAQQMYRDLGAHMRGGGDKDACWEATQALIQFRGLLFEHDVYSWKSAELDLLIFDELDQFTEFQFWYMQTRLRSLSQIKPYCRASVNPDATSWVRALIDPWIGSQGFACFTKEEAAEQARLMGKPRAYSGQILWITKRGDELRHHWTRRAALKYIEEIGDPDLEPKSLSFIPATLDDNPALLRADPGYRGQLAMQDPVTRARMLDGNWDIKVTSGALFNRSWFDLIDREPDPRDVKYFVRGWDTAYSAPTTKNPNPDYTACVKLALLNNGNVVVCDVQRTRQETGGVEVWMQGIVRHDGPKVIQALWQDPAAGKALVHRLQQVIRAAAPNSSIDVVVEKLDKVQYAQIFSGAIDPRPKGLGHNIAAIVNGPTIAAYLSELEAFPEKGQKKDMVDASSRAWLWIDTRANSFANAFSKAMSLID
jgi:phage terminase large subunit-like protein